jgi:hypothetical protein
MAGPYPAETCFQECRASETKADRYHLGIEGGGCSPVHRLVHLERVDCVPEGYLRDRDARDGTGHLPALMRPVIARIINAVCMENNWKPF